MTGWVITCINKSSDDAIFLLFVDNRHLSESFHTNVFCRSNVVGSLGGRCDINVDDKVYGVCGTADGPLKNGASVRNAQSSPTPLQQYPGEPYAVTCQAKGDNLVFSNAVTTMSTPAEGQIGVQVGRFDLDRYPNAFIGYGKVVPKDSDIVTPVLTTKAYPTRPLKMIPEPKFFVANTPSTETEPSRGYISSAGEFGHVASIDFTLQPKDKRYAEVILDDEGNYNVVYHYGRRL